MKIKEVFLFPNGMIATFDTDGKQIPELQGICTEDLTKKIYSQSDEDTIWTGDWKLPILKNL